MGNEKSVPIGIEVEDEIIDTTDYWIQRVATINKGATKISVFEDTTACDKNENNLFIKFSKNLMIHRHPNILRFITSWTKNGKYYVATEAAKPLRQVINSQTPLQLCVGLYNILKAIIFLHEKALSSHNNLCKDSIFVTTDGTWKLGRMEYLCRFSNATYNYLKESRIHRYKPAVNPNESNTFPNPVSLIDQYAFNILVQEILDGKTNADIPTVIEFKQFCKDSLSSSNSSLSQLITHPFFTHRFIAIYSFLIELPLKDTKEREDFFKILGDELMSFPEELVASQLITLLLSRIVLLDIAAQNFVLPRILHLKDDEHPDSLFSERTAKNIVGPRIFNIFCIRDCQIRLIFLKHFVPLCKFFSHQQLRTLILPELLVGIKDTNDALVEATLRAVSDLIPILGASTVIGKSRTKLFSDGSPTMLEFKTKSTAETSNKNFKLAQEICQNFDVTDLSLIERPSPDGGEDTDNTVPADEEETESWSDWDGQPSYKAKEAIVVEEEAIKNQNQSRSSPDILQDDILQLDVKCSELICSVPKDDIDEMFKSMEPVILKTQIFQVKEDSSNIQNKFEAKNSDCENCEGWADDISNWDVEAEKTDVFIQ